MKENKTLHEDARDITVLADYDVVVVGGGIAGVSAALAARRAGAKVCILERFCGLGGLATIGNVIIYLPLDDGMGHQVSAGICEELIKLSVDDEPKKRDFLRIGPIPECWQPGGDVAARKEQRYQTGFNPVTFMFKMERLLLKERIKIYFDTRFVGVLKKGDSITAVIVESKGGRQAITTRAVVDSSGDADVCHAAGEKTVSIGGNVRSGWFYYVDNGTVKLNPWSQRFKAGTNNPEAGRTFRGDSADHVTQQIIETREYMMNALERMKSENPGHDMFPIMIPTMPTHRMTRRLAGTVTLRPTDDHRWFDDCVGITPDWRKKGPVYCIPLRAIAGVKTPNLITAGRCISSFGDTWDVTRVIPTCAVTGEAAGVCAAFYAKDPQSPPIRKLDIIALQKYLRRRNVLIDRKLVEG
ncbi:MAG: FAD-dependent oxidoreductase [Victivallales bacterium]|nr:FAD-dependent oxidoreductase [Victivallales bacterium]